MKITFINLHTASNRGNAAIIEGMKSGLKRYFPNMQITVLSNFPESVRILNSLDSEYPLTRHLSFLKFLKLAYPLLWAHFYRKGIRLPNLGEKRIKNYIESDLIISVGGGFLNDNRFSTILRRLYELYFSKLLGKRVIIYAPSIGPFHTRLGKALARFVFNKMDLITVRDSESRDVLHSIGVGPLPIYITADAAWSLEPLDRKEGLKLLNREGIDLSDRLKVSMSIRDWEFKGDNKVDRFRYIQALAAIGDYLIERYDAQLFFLSTSTGIGGSRSDDRFIAREVLDQMRNPNGAKILYGEYLPQELSAIYGNMDLHIGSRMHSLILAMLSGTPVVAIQHGSYEFKMKSLMDFLGLSEWIIDISQISSELLIGLVGKAIEKREQLKDQITKKLVELKTLSEKNAKLVYEFITGST